MQIPKTKYKAGFKLFQDHKQLNKGIVNINTLNSDLRRLDYSRDEIDSFWASTIELRSLLTNHKYEQERMFADYQFIEDPLSHYEDRYEMSFDIK